MTKCLLCGNRINAPLSLTFLISFRTYHQPVICNKCRHQFRRIRQDHCCRDCSKAGDFKNHLCPDCVRWRQVTGTRFKNDGLYQYNSMMSEYMHRYKFMGDYRLRNVFQGRFSRFVKGMHRLVIPIPLHQSTYQQRGFNQVEGLLGSVPVVKALITKQSRKSIPQSHKSREDRLRLAQPFRLLPNAKDRIENQDVAIADDVYTTGTTVRHAARLLKRAGVKSVIGITLAR